MFRKLLGDNRIPVLQPVKDVQHWAGLLVQKESLARQHIVVRVVLDVIPAQNLKEAEVHRPPEPGHIQAEHAEPVRQHFSPDLSLSNPVETQPVQY